MSQRKKGVIRLIINIGAMANFALIAATPQIYPRALTHNKELHRRIRQKYNMVQTGGGDSDLEGVGSTSTSSPTDSHTSTSDSHSTSSSGAAAGQAGRQHATGQAGGFLVDKLQLSAMVVLLALNALAKYYPRYRVKMRGGAAAVNKEINAYRYGLHRLPNDTLTKLAELSVQAFPIAPSDARYAQLKRLGVNMEELARQQTATQSGGSVTPLTGAATATLLFLLRTIIDRKWGAKKGSVAPIMGQLKSFISSVASFGRVKKSHKKVRISGGTIPDSGPVDNQGWPTETEASCWQPSWSAFCE